MIFVDELRSHGWIYPDAQRHGIEWCHLTTNGDREELHAFARKLDLKPMWFHRHPNPRLNQYILLPGKRRLALQHGAQERRWEESRKLAEQTEQIGQEGDSL